MDKSKNSTVFNTKQLEAFGAKYPEFFDHAIACVKAWGEGDRQLQHCIAVALKEMHEMGKRGEDPPKLGLTAAYLGTADRYRLFAIDFKTEKKPPVAAPSPEETPSATKRLSRTPSAPVVRRLRRS